MKKRLLLFLFFLLSVVPSTAFALTTVSPTENFYINDYANILSNETEKYILEHSVSLANATKAQIVVVTIPSLNGENLEEYSTALFRKFGIGDKDENNGLLLLLALEERKMRVEVGYGLEGLLPDGKTGRFQDDYMIPYFRNDDFDEGMLNGYKAFFQEIANYYEYDGNVDEPTSNDSEDDDIIMAIITIIQLGMWIFIIYLMINKAGSGTPTVIFYKNGKEETTAARIIGDTSKDKIVAKFKASGFIK